MTSFARRTMRWCGAAMLLALLTGCAATQPRDREEATQRWNAARAQVKTKLAADQLAAGNVDEAAKDLAEACRLNGDNAELLPLQARVHLARGETDRAAELLEQASPADSSGADRAYLLGVVRQQQERWEEALAAFRRAAELDQHEVAYVVAAAQAYLQLGQADQGLAYLTEKAGQFGWTDAYQTTLAECCEQLEDWNGAATAWQRVAGAPGDAAGLRQRLAVALYRCGRCADAVPVIREVLAGDEEASTSLRLMLAGCQAAMGQPDESRQQLQSILQRERENLPALRLLAQNLAEAGDFAAASRVAQQALSLHPGDVRTLELSAALAWRAGNVASAASSAARLMQVDAGNPVAERILERAGSPQR